MKKIIFGSIIVVLISIGVYASLNSSYLQGKFSAKVESPDVVSTISESTAVCTIKPVSSTTSALGTLSSKTKKIYTLGEWSVMCTNDSILEDVSFLVATDDGKYDWSLNNYFSGTYNLYLRKKVLLSGDTEDQGSPDYNSFFGDNMNQELKANTQYTINVSGDIWSSGGKSISDGSLEIWYFAVTSKGTKTIWSRFNVGTQNNDLFYTPTLSTNGGIPGGYTFIIY